MIGQSDSVGRSPEMPDFCPSKEITERRTRTVAIGVDALDEIHRDIERVVDQAARTPCRPRTHRESCPSAHVGIAPDMERNDRKPLGLLVKGDLRTAAVATG